MVKQSDGEKGPCLVFTVPVGNISEKDARLMVKELQKKYNKALDFDCSILLPKNFDGGVLPVAKRLLNKLPDDFNII